MEWRFILRDPLGNEKGSHGMSDPFETLESFAVAGDGNCLEARFRGLASDLDIGPRDVLSLQVREDPEGDWISRYAGTVVTAGAPRSKRNSRFKLVGLEKRVREWEIASEATEGGDVGAMVRSVLDNADNRPPEIFFSEPFVPDVNFEMGERMHFHEKLGDFLDDMAASLPGFVVPEGETYTYQGIEFTEGDIIPPVTWGVDRLRRIFFLRDFAEHSLTEAPGETHVEFNELDAEGVVSAVRFDFGRVHEPRHLALPLRQAPPAILTYLAESDDVGTYGRVTKRVPIPPMVGMFQNVPGLVVEDGGGTNPANLLDGDPETSSEITLDGNGNATIELRFTMGTVDALLFEADEDARLDLAVVDEVGDATTTVSFTRIRDPLILMPRLERNRAFFILRGEASASVDVYQARALKLDEDLLDRMANAYFRFPAADPGRLTRPGDVLTPRPRIELTLADSTVLEVGASRYTYSFTRRQGVQTEVRLGQPFDPELLQEAAVIQAKADRAELRAVNYANWKTP